MAAKVAPEVGPNKVSWCASLTRVVNQLLFMPVLAAP